MPPAPYLERLTTEFEIVRERARKLGPAADELIDRCNGLLADIIKVRAEAKTSTAVRRAVGYLVAEKHACLALYEELAADRGELAPPLPPAAPLVVVLPPAPREPAPYRPQEVDKRPDPKPLPPPPPGMKVIEKREAIVPKPSPSEAPRAIEKEVPKGPLAKQAIPGIMAGEESAPVVRAALPKCEECGEEFVSNYKRQRRCKRCIETPHKEKADVVTTKVHCSSCKWRRACAYGCEPGKPCEHAWMGWNCGRERHRECMPLDQGIYYEKE